MELEEFKKVWRLKKDVAYSQAELNSIFHIKQKHSFAELKSGFSRDLKLAILISVVFIVALQILDFRTSNFWSASMALFALQHVLFYQFQVFLLRKYSEFNNNISQSLSQAISKIRGLLWFYRLWPAVLTIILSMVYATLFKPEQPVWLMLLLSLILATIIAVISNIISAALVREHLLKLQNLRQDLIKLSE